MTGLSTQIANNCRARARLRLGQHRLALQLVLKEIEEFEEVD